MLRSLLVALLWPTVMVAQTADTVFNPFTQKQDYVGSKLATALPATCSVGQLFFKTAATIGLYFCSATNTWTIVSQTPGTGITDINSDSTSSQTLATGTSGTNFAIATSAGTHTFNLPTASGTNTGKLSNTDWTTFNNKQGALTLTTTGSSGASTLVGSTLNIPQYSGGGGGSGTVTSVGLAGTANQITVTGSTPITSSGSWTLSIPTNPTFPGHITTEGVTATGATGTGKFVFDGSPTIVTPTIASFTNATHDHTNAAGGGQISDAALSAAVSVAKGGTGRTSLTNHGVLIGASTSAITQLSAAGADTVLMGVASSDPAFVSVANCSNDGGHALVYSASSHAFSCVSVSGGGGGITVGSSLPATCTVGDLYFLDTGTKGMYQCNVTDTWTSVSPAGGQYIDMTVDANGVTIADVITTPGGIATQAKVSAQYRVCDMVIGDTSGSAISNGQLGPQKGMCFLPTAGTIVEMDVHADGGTPNVIVGVDHAGSVSNIVSSALATASSGARACSRTAAVTGIDGATTCSATLQNTTFVAGDYLKLVSGTAGGTAKLMTVHVVYSLNNW